MTATFALLTLSNALISLAQRMAGSVNLRCGMAGHDEWQEWADTGWSQAPPSDQAKVGVAVI
jgi:hypothetical protein